MQVAPVTRATRRWLTLLVVLPVLAAAGCGYGSQAADDAPPSVAAEGAGVGGLDEVRIGYFANITHATALVGLEQGLFQEELGGTRIKELTFNAGPAEIEALNGGAIDIGWIGPSPAINGYTRSGGSNLRIVAGSASGGVSLVVNPRKVPDAAALAGRTIASPQLGNTQDVALLDYLARHGTTVDAQTGRGDVKVQRVDNKEIPALFERGDVDGAWVPEPVAARLVTAGGKVLVDERDLWPDGRFVVTNVVVSQRFLAAHPEAVEAVLRGSVRTNAWINGHPGQAKASAAAKLKALSGTELPPKVLDLAFGHIEVLDDPLAGTLREEAAHAVAAGLLRDPLLDRIYDLGPLNRVLRAAGLPAVDDAGLGAHRQ
ncbi:ABC transporter substrate-binding protein [Streptomyces sp. NPDC003717]|uniref:ABC transporter substrate-binding protein n=1 Tax=Streptomyces sp. NPDC003717 TaxID=3154276 RepID=UPI0033A59BB5